MREIKFRAWNHKKMVYDMRIVAHGELNILDFIFLGEFCGETTVFMQFIGLKDRNDKEIYEGDIIHFDSSEIGGEEITGEIIFNDDLALANLEFGIWTKKGFYRTDFLGIIEVLGNIYENPELLKEDSK